MAAKSSAAVSRSSLAPRQIRQGLDRLSKDKSSAKFAHGKALLAASQKKPKSLYPYFEDFVKLLQHENSIIQWTAIRIIGNLAAVDSRGKIPGIIDGFLKPIRGPVMITAANTIAAAAKIAAARPELAEKVIDAILGVESAHYQTDECRNVAIGHALTALASLRDAAARRRDVLAFAQRQTRNPRTATQKKAQKLMKFLSTAARPAVQSASSSG